MNHLEEISVGRLQEALENVEGKKPAQRLIAAIAHKNGVSQTELAAWYGVERRTIYSWLKRLEAEPIEEAVSDRERTGRPRKLDDEEQRQLEGVLRKPPSEVGYDASTWNPALVQRYLEAEFDVAYSRPSCRRLMKESGLRYLKPQSGSEQTADGTAPEEWSGRWVPE